MHQKAAPQRRGLLSADPGKLKPPPIRAKKPEPVRKPEQVKRSIHKDQRTYDAGIMAAMGIVYNRVIEQRTGLSKGQLAYRLRETGASEMRKETREGRSPIAYYLMEKARDYAQREFTEKLREKLNL